MFMIAGLNNLSTWIWLRVRFAVKVYGSLIARRPFWQEFVYGVRDSLVGGLQKPTPLRGLGVAAAGACHCVLCPSEAVAEGGGVWRLLDRVVGRGGVIGICVA